MKLLVAMAAGTLLLAGTAQAEPKWFACDAHVDSNQFAVSEAFQYDIGSATTDARGGSNEIRQWRAAKSSMELAWLRYLQSRYHGVTAASCWGPEDSRSEAASSRDGQVSYNETRVDTGWSY